MSDMLCHHRQSAEPERIVAIEYHHEGKDGASVPFNVFTVRLGDPSRKGWISGLYDFEYCKRDDLLYYHLSGSGGRFYVHPKSPAKPLCELWWDRDCVWPTNGGNLSGRKLGLATLRRFGFHVLDRPLVIAAESSNPFDGAIHDDVEYCTKCRDFLPTGDLCSHIWYCDKCGDYSSPQSRCKHRRPY